MKIVLLCFGVGTIANVAGTEKIFVDMANAFTDSGHEVWAVWNDEPGVVPYFTYREAVHQVNLGLGRIKVPFYFKVQREFNKALHREAENKVDAYKTAMLSKALRERVDLDGTDCMVCYEFNSVMVANSISRGRIPVVAMVHNSIENQIGKLTARQRKEAGKADVYQVLMPSFVEKAKPLLTSRIVCIPNTVTQVGDSDVADLAAAKDTFTIVHVGRIEREQKRQMILVKSFSELAGKYPDWKLVLAGPTDDRSYLEEITRFAEENKLEKRIEFKGVVDNPLEVMRQSDIFAFPSAYEGFGIVLVEAMSAGLPSVGFGSAPAVNELIAHEKNGLLARDEKDFTRQLERLMKDRELRVKLGKNAHETAKQYAPEAIWKRWENLLTEVCKAKRRA